MPSAPNRNKRIFSRRVEVSGWVNKLIIQNARAANVQRRVTPVSGLIHNGRRYFNAFIFNPLKVLEIIM